MLAFVKYFRYYIGLIAEAVGFQLDLGILIPLGISFYTFQILSYVLVAVAGAAVTFSAIVFNLGWLPGGDKSVTTLWETTKVALEKALSLLEKHGVLLLCAYPGHEAK